MANLRHTPGTVNIELFGRDRFSTTVYFKDANGTVVDMAGTYTAQVRQNRTDAEHAATLVCGTTNITAGTLTLTMGTTTVDGLITGAATRWDGYWDLYRDQGSGVGRTILAGTFGVTLEVTR